MKERPILFSGPMVRALLTGTKTQTRRVVKPQPQMVTDNSIVPWEGNAASLARLLEQSGQRCPYGQPGDRLWVREAWRAELTWDSIKPSEIPAEAALWYEADGQQRGNGLGHKFKGKLRPGMFMCRWASRITLEVTGVRVERLNGISTADCWAEGIASSPDVDPLHEYRDLWEQINGPGSWDANPWVWVVEFRRITP